MNLNTYTDICHKASVAAGWWTKGELDLKVDSREQISLAAAKIALIHSEVSEALEGLRKRLNDDHLPHRKMVEVEFADALIRIFDLAGFLGLDLQGAFTEKMEYNLNRADHKPSARQAEGGKVI